MKTSEWSNLVYFILFYFKQPFLGHILKKNRHIHFLGAWSFLLIHIRFTPNEGPKGFVN